MIDIRSILAAAAEDVEKSGVPDDLRAAAFTAAVALRTGATSPTQDLTSAIEPTLVPKTDWETAVSGKLGVSADDVREAFDLVDGRMHLTIAPSRFSRNRAAAMKDVALLICAARQAAGIDEDGWTPVGAVRDECREMGVLDASNFAAEISRLDEVLSFRGTGRSRHLRVNRRGFEHAASRLTTLLRS